jgi:hypothetical protein
MTHITENHLEDMIERIESCLQVPNLYPFVKDTLNMALYDYILYKDILKSKIN